MNLYLIGHDYRYAAEQMLLTLFPDERPVYPDGRPTGDRAELRLMSGAKVTTATCVLVYQGRTANGRTSVPNEELTDPNETDRRLQGAVKRAFYRAAMGIGLPHRPWGMLTGVRPGKLMTPLLAQGMGDVQAARYFERHYDVAPARAALVVRTAHATLRAMDSLGEKDVCLYVGIPFCPTRCAYCSFVSQSVEKSMALVPEFLQALAREIAATAEAVHRAGLRVVSLYIGGGNFIQYINEHGCNFVPNDESRVIYSTQYDMIQGEDKGQARNLLADYITEQGTIDPVITSEWKITNVPFENKFTDVTEEDWFHDVVLELAASGVVNGMTETTFEPQGTLTRAEFATMLYRVSYAPVVTGESTYSDVKTGDWYYDAVVWATEAGVVNGMGDGTFAPNDNITRQEMATMLYRLAKAEKVEEDKLASFPDAASVADWAKDAMNWAVSTEIVNGSTHDDKVNYLDPTATALRCQAAAVACRYLALSK